MRYPPAQRTSLGSLFLTGSWDHSLLQSSILTTGTSAICRSTVCQFFMPVFVSPHPATRHFALSFNLFAIFGIWIVWILLPSRAFFTNCTRRKKSSEKVAVFLFLTRLDKSSTYFEQHDVIAIYYFSKIRMFASPDTVSHGIIDCLEIVGAENNTQIPEWSLRNLSWSGRVTEWLNEAEEMHFTYLHSQCAAVSTKSSLMRNPPHLWWPFFCTEAIYCIFLSGTSSPFMIALPSAVEARNGVNDKTFLHLRQQFQTYH